MNRIAVAVLGLSIATSASASSPGQPLDCSDWVFASPQYSCTVYSPPGALPYPAPWYLGKSPGMVPDNAGGLVAVRFTYISYNNNEWTSPGRIEVVRTTGQGETVLAHIEDRDIGGLLDQIRPLHFVDNAINRGSSGSPNEPFTFDPVNGVLLLPLHTYGGNYPEERWIAAIHGFPTLLDLFQSYVPAPAAWTFTVPALPEGLPAADHFDTYYGPLTSPINLAHAQPLQCAYPATPPAPGDYLTVADPLPNPAVGSGRYYLTTVTHQGEIRAGRRAVNGALRGRDASGIPACVEPKETAGR